MRFFDRIRECDPLIESDRLESLSGFERLEFLFGFERIESLFGFEKIDFVIEYVGHDSVTVLISKIVGLSYEMNISSLRSPVLFCSGNIKSISINPMLLFV